MREKGVHNFTPSERELIRDIVLDGMCKFKLNDQILMDVEARAHISISLDTLYRVKMSINSEANKLIKTLMKTDEFRTKYMETVLRIEHLIKSQWDVYNSTKDPSVRSICLDRIHNYTVTRHKLYDFLPILCAMKPFEDAMTLLNNQSKYGGMLGSKGFGV